VKDRLEAYLPYIPLHVHSTNSPGVGMMTATEIVDRAAFLGMRAIALTDHWNTYGHYELCKKAAAKGINPVLGAEVQHLSLTGHDGLFHLTLLAENKTGYANLTRLVSLHFDKDGPPHVTVEELTAMSEGIIALSGCIRGETNQAVLHGNLAMEREAAERLLEIYGEGSFFLEIMTHNHEREQLVMDKMILLSRKLEIPMVVTNNDRFISNDDSGYYEVLRKLAGDMTIEETPETLPEYVLKTRKDLESYFYFMEDALDISGEIADRCHVGLIDGTTISFSDDPSEDVTLSEKCNRRFLLEFHTSGVGGSISLKNRMMSELERASVEEMSGFLLFLEKLFRRCRRSGEWIELVGSDLCESVVAYLLGVVPLNPAEHGLIFESFGAPAPGVPPVVELLRSKGQRERFMSILEELLPGYNFRFQLQREDSSFSTLVKDLAEKLEIGESLANEILQSISSSRRQGGLADLLESSEHLSHLYNTESKVKKLLHSAAALHGRVSHFIHNTSKIVVLPPEAENKVSWVSGAGGEKFVMLDREAIAAHGGWKLVVQQSHFLSALAGTVNRIQTPAADRNHDKQEEWRPRDLNDSATFEMICRGDSSGVYLLESRGIRDLLTAIKPDSFDDLVNVISLYRPAPLEGRLWQKYLENADKKGKVYLPHHSIAGPLEMTRGLLLYREQVCEILLGSAGLTGQDAVFVERALGRKETSNLQSARLIFIRGAMDIDIDEEDAQKIFDYLLHNIGFTFDKAFSCTQAYISYRSAFLKAHHPVEYFSALLDSTGDIRERKKRYLDYLETSGPKVFPPDVNFSGRGFLAENEAIRSPMSEACDMTGEEIDTVLEERGRGSYQSLEDFLSRLSGRLAMETSINMAECGLFDSMEGDRKETRDMVLAFYDEHGRAGEFFRTHTEPPKPDKEDHGQLSLFDD
jgi:DNA polymerase-3 subunit alpha